VLFSPFSLPHTGIQVQHLPIQNNTNRSEHHVLVRNKEDIWFIRMGMHKSWVPGHRGNYLIFVVTDIISPLSYLKFCAVS
jgi:hypothetical protein